MAEKQAYRRNSGILLAFSPFNEENVEIPLDSAPTATIKYQSPTGRSTLQNVILDPSVTGGYEAAFVIPDSWLYGEYVITYTYVSEGLTYEQDTPFVLENKADLLEDQAVFAKELLDNIWADEYIPSHHQQANATVEVSGHEIRITLIDNPLYNYDYKVIVDGIKSVSGQELRREVISTYQAEYSPLFSTPNDVHSVLKGLYRLFEIKEVYVALRDAGQKALQMLRQQNDPNNSRYREYSDRNENYLALTKYVVYEAAYNLMLDLYNKFLAAFGIPGYREVLDSEDPLMELLGSGFTLGDFSIAGVGDDKEFNPYDEEHVNSFLKRLRYALEGIRKELKFWQDAMMSRNARGYTNPSTVTYKSGVASPESRDI